MPAAVCVHVAAASPCVVPERETLAAVALSEVDSSLAHIVHIRPNIIALGAGLHPA